MNNQYESDAFGLQPFSYETEEETRRSRRRSPSRHKQGGRHFRHKPDDWRRGYIKARPRCRTRYLIRQSPDPGSEYIRWVQNTLNQVMGLNLPVDGVIGVETRSAIRSFQTRQGLPATGLVGPDTENALRTINLNPSDSNHIKQDNLSDAPESYFSNELYEIPSEPYAPQDEFLFGTENETGVAMPQSSESSTPIGPFGILVAKIPGRQPFNYKFSSDDVLWTARFLVGEAGGRDDLGNQAVIWAMLNRYALFTHRYYKTFHQFIRAYSTPLQPVLKSAGAAKRHSHKPEFVKTGGTYNGTNIPRGQLAQFIKLQQTPWNRLSSSARSLASRALSGQVTNPIGNATEFASTRIYFKSKYNRWPKDFDEWRKYTEEFANHKKWLWVGQIPGLDQMSNAFFIQRRIQNLAPGSVMILPASSQVNQEVSTAKKPRTNPGTQCGKAGFSAALKSQPGGRCIGPVAPICPPVPGILSEQSVNNIPFEYVSNVGKNPTTKLFYVTKRIRPRTQKFLPSVKVALTQFISNMNRFGIPVEALLTAGSYCCRCISNKNELSNHSSGHAFDLVGVRWASSGGRETIVHNWMNPIERHMLRRINACLRLSFATVLDYYVKGHQDHFHVDTPGKARQPRYRSTLRFTQEALSVVLNRTIPVTGKFDEATQTALMEFAGVSRQVLKNSAPLNEILDRLFTKIATMPSAPMQPNTKSTLTPEIRLPSVAW